MTGTDYARLGIPLDKLRKRYSKGKAKQWLLSQMSPADVINHHTTATTVAIAATATSMSCSP